MSSILDKLAKRLLKIRTERKMSQEEFSYVCNLDRGHYSHIELAEKDIQLSTVEKIADGLGISVSELFNFDE